jgi:hypothetical protein
MRRIVGAAALAILAAGAMPAQDVKDELRPGLIAEFFYMDQELQDFPAIAPERKADLRRIDKAVNFESTAGKFAETEYEDCFYVRWTGVLRVPKAAKWTLYTESDDGSRIWIDGKQVVENGGLHAMEEKSGEVDLKAGDHPIKIDLFENTGEAGLRVSWETEGMTKEVVPDKFFLHKKDKDLDKD